MPYLTSQHRMHQGRRAYQTLGPGGAGVLHRAAANMATMVRITMLSPMLVVRDAAPSRWPLPLALRPLRTGGGLIWPTMGAEEHDAVTDTLPLCQQTNAAGLGLCVHRIDQLIAGLLDRARAHSGRGHG